MITLAHVTHEAVRKIGGIGAVIEGLTTAPSYRREVGRTILIGPLFDVVGPAEARLGPNGTVRYSSLDGLDTGDWQAWLGPVVQRYGTGLVYGTRILRDEWSGNTAEVEVLLVDVANMDRAVVDHFKWLLYEKFRIRSDRYEYIWDYEQYLRLALPGFEALQRLPRVGEPGPVVVLAHEFMGIPLALRALLADDPNFVAVFHAHEVASVRRIVEDHPGHDTMFYNVLRAASAAAEMHDRRYLEDIFGSQDAFFKHALVRPAYRCDAVFAVGDFVRDELHFLAEDYARREIEVVPNGIPATEITPAEWQRSRRLLLDYAERLLGWRPDFVFSHVARLVNSKAFWRDVQVLDHLDGRLWRAGQSAVFFVLSTEGAQRRQEDVERMEREYGWPWQHRIGYPDLTGSEIGFNEFLQDFNRRARAIKVVFINQFGWEPARCGRRMPAEMRFADLRIGTDLEFGQSIYEPFGISQFEPLTFGALCVPSSVCGCVPFALRCNRNEVPAGVIVADYVTLPSPPTTVAAARHLSPEECQRHEADVARWVAEQVWEWLRHLPEGRENLIRERCALARQMCWEEVAARYFLPAVRRAVLTAARRAGQGRVAAGSPP